MSLASIASGADGIMLEVHPNPSQSAVDPHNLLITKNLNIDEKNGHLSSYSFKRRICKINFL